MKKRMLMILWFITMVAVPVMAVTPRSLVCNYDGENKNRIYQVHVAVGGGCTFRLPEGYEIQDYVVFDKGNFSGECNGTIAVCQPKQAGKSTNVTIYTKNDKLFVFHVSSEPSDVVDELVMIDVNDPVFFQQKVRQEARKMIAEQTKVMENEKKEQVEAAKDETKDKMLFNVESRYEVKNNKFDITKVVDDGGLTYIMMDKSKTRPAVFVGTDDKTKNLEPVKYTDNGEYYTVHYVLKAGEGKKLYLKNEKDITEIVLKAKS